MSERSSVVYVLMYGFVDVYTSAHRAVDALKMRFPEFIVRHPIVFEEKRIAEVSHGALVNSLRLEHSIVATPKEGGDDVDLVRRETK